MFGINIEKQAIKILTAKMQEGGYTSIFFYIDESSETGFTFDFYTPEDAPRIVKQSEIDYMNNRIKELENKLLNNE